jgi:hypothetical protein
MVSFSFGDPAVGDLTKVGNGFLPEEEKEQDEE